MISFFGAAWQSVTGYAGEKYQKYPTWFNLGGLFVYLYGAGYFALSYLHILQTAIVNAKVSMPQTFYDWFGLLAVILLVASTIIYLAGLVLNIKSNLNKMIPLWALGAYFFGQLAYGYVRGLNTNLWNNPDVGYVIGHLILFIIPGVVANGLFATRLRKRISVIENIFYSRLIQSIFLIPLFALFGVLAIIHWAFPTMENTVWHGILFSISLMNLPLVLIFAKWAFDDLKIMARPM